MICPKCGSTASDDAEFCGNCGEVLKKEIRFPQDSYIPSDLADSDLTISLEEDATIVLTYINKQNEFNIIVYNKSSNPIYELEVKLTGSHQIYIGIPLKEFREILPKTSQTTSFTIIPKKTGTFNMTATLTSKAGHFLTLPFKVSVEEAPIETIQPRQTPVKTTIPSRKTEQVTVALVIISLISIILIIAGIPTIFSSTPTGITLIVIGLIFLAIGTKGRCLYCFAVFAACDCDC